MDEEECEIILVGQGGKRVDMDDLDIPLSTGRVIVEIGGNNAREVAIVAEFKDGLEINPKEPVLNYDEASDLEYMVDQGLSDQLNGELEEVFYEDMFDNFDVVDTWNPDGEEENTEEIDSFLKVCSPKHEDIKPIVLKDLREKIPRDRHRSSRHSRDSRDDSNRRDSQYNNNSSSSQRDGNNRRDNEKDRNDNRRTDSERDRSRLDNARDKRRTTDDGDTRIVYYDKNKGSTDNDREKSRTDNEKDRSRSRTENDKDRSRADNEKDKSRTDNDKDRNRPDNEKDRNRPDNEKDRSRTDNKKDRSRTDSEKDRRRSDNEKDRKRPDNEKDRRRTDNEKDRSKTDNEKDRSKTDSEKDRSRPDNEKDRSRPDNEKDRSRPDNEKDRSKADTEKARSRSDNEKDRSKSDHNRNRIRTDHGRERYRHEIHRDRSRRSPIRKEKDGRGKKGVETQISSSKDSLKVDKLEPTENKEKVDESQASSSKDSLNVPQASSKDTLNAPQTCSKDLLDAPQTSSKDSLDAPQTTSKDSLDAPQASSKDSLDAPQTSSKDSLDAPQISSKGSLNVPQTSSKDSLDTPQTSSKDSLNVPQASSKDSLDVPQASSKDSLNVPQASSKDSLNVPQASSSTDSLNAPETILTEQSNKQKVCDAIEEEKLSLKDTLLHISGTRSKDEQKIPINVTLLKISVSNASSEKEQKLPINDALLSISGTNTSSNVDTNLKDSLPPDKAVPKSEDELQWEYMLMQREELRREQDELIQERIKTEKARKESELFTDNIRREEKFGRSEHSPISFSDGKMMRTSRERSLSLRRKRELSRERSPSLGREHEPFRKISPINFQTDSSSNAGKDVSQSPLDREESLRLRYEAFKDKLEREKAMCLGGYRIRSKRERRSSSRERSGSPGWERHVYTKSSHRSSRSGLGDEMHVTITGLPSRKRSCDRGSRVSYERMSTPSLSFELSPVSSDRERMRSLSRSLSRERYNRRRRSRPRYRRGSYSPRSRRSSRSGSFVSLSSAESHEMKRKRKRSPFLRELERTFAEQKRRADYLATKTYTAPIVPPNRPYFEAAPRMAPAIYPPGTVPPPHFETPGFPPPGMHPAPHPLPEYHPSPQPYPERPYSEQPYSQQSYPQQQPYPPPQQPLPVINQAPPPVRVLVPMPTPDQQPPSNYPPTTYPPPTYAPPNYLPPTYPPEMCPPPVEKPTYPETKQRESLSPVTPPPPVISTSKLYTQKIKSLSNILESSLKGRKSTTASASELISRCEEAIHMLKSTDIPGRFAERQPSLHQITKQDVHLAAIAEFRSPLHSVPEVIFNFTEPRPEFGRPSSFQKEASASYSKASASGSKASASGSKASASGSKASASGSKASASGSKASASGSKASELLKRANSPAASKTVQPCPRCVENYKKRFSSRASQTNPVSLRSVVTQVCDELALPRKDCGVQTSDLPDMRNSGLGNSSDFSFPESLSDKFDNFKRNMSLTSANSSAPAFRPNSYTDALPFQSESKGLYRSYESFPGPHADTYSSLRVTDPDDNRNRSQGLRLKPFSELHKPSIQNPMLGSKGGAYPGDVWPSEQRPKSILKSSQTYSATPSTAMFKSFQTDVGSAQSSGGASMGVTGSRLPTQAGNWPRSSLSAMMGSSNLGSSDLGPSDLGPSNLGPSNLGPSNLAPSSLSNRSEVGSSLSRFGPSFSSSFMGNSRY